MSPRFDEVARLKELEKKATPGKWYKGEMDEGDCDEINGRVQGWETGVMVYDRELGIFHPTNEIDNLVTVCSPDQESDADLIANLRNATPWLLEAAACFQPGMPRGSPESHGRTCRRAAAGSVMLIST